MECAGYSVHQYLKGKVADYTISDNVIESVCFDRGIEPSTHPSGVEERVLNLCYADLLKYVYLQPSTTKSYAVANGTWSQKEGATSLNENDRKRILAALRKLYAENGELENIPAATSTIKMRSRGLRIWKR